MTETLDNDMVKTIQGNREGTRQAALAALRRLKNCLPSKYDVGAVYMLTMKVGDIEDIVLRNAMESLERALVEEVTP